MGKKEGSGCGLVPATGGRRWPLGCLSAGVGCLLHGAARGGCGSGSPRGSGGDAKRVGGVDGDDKRAAA